MANEADGFRRILSVLDRMEVPYLVGGSVASSVHGIPRFAQDVDLIVDLRLDQIDEFADQLKPDFYADKQMIRGHWRAGRSCNLIHYESAYKFNIFPLKRDEFSQAEMRRRALDSAAATAEDTLLNKLRWDRDAGQTSELQWHDVRGIVRVRGAELDLDYLRTWAPKLGVADLLDRLFKLEPISSE